MKLTKKIIAEVSISKGREKDEDEEEYLTVPCSKCGYPMEIGDKIEVTGYHLEGKYYGHKNCSRR